MGLYSDFLLTVDFDRTLTAPDSTIPARNVEAIRYFMERGGVFTVNTGRSIPTFRRYLDQIPVNAPLLLYNGSAAYDGGELTQCHPIELDMWQTLEEVAARFPEMHLEVQSTDFHYCLREDPAWDAFCDALGCAHARATPGSDLGPFLKFTLLGQIREPKMADMFRGSQEELRQIDAVADWIRRRWGDKLEVFRAAPRLLDVHAGGVSKLRAARELQARLGRKWLVCVGDAENDLPMLQGADYAFCPADGVVADRFDTVCPCGEGAVADVIDKKIPEILRVVHLSMM